MSNEHPIVKELEPGTYYSCTCGKSKTGAFCDGSHGEHDRGPIEFVIDEKKTVGLCNCGKSRTTPFCDGAHQEL